ncbi:group III truncated hemoglobin [Pikeienuella piscinae]|uniref:Group III truncated hemoglobin n=2 Tax=Pikeienuella piscinae TaxID=2748098 RepID=A0A7M3T6Y9_9RHOB|nr:group III truncated hemoglobin [Pikeienuella piscinae]
MIERLIRRFYDTVRRDPELGPIFDKAIGDDWEPHLRKMFDFWSSVMLTTGRYKGQPVPVHQRIDSLRPELFEVWLMHFRQTAEEVCPPDAARLFIERAERIARSLTMTLFFRLDGFRTTAPREYAQ